MIKLIPPEEWMHWFTMVLNLRCCFPRDSSTKIRSIWLGACSFRVYAVLYEVEHETPLFCLLFSNSRRLQYLFYLHVHGMHSFTFQFNELSFCIKEQADLLCHINMRSTHKVLFDPFISHKWHLNNIYAWTGCEKKQSMGQWNSAKCANAFS